MTAGSGSGIWAPLAAAAKKFAATDIRQHGLQALFQGHCMQQLQTCKDVMRIISLDSFLAIGRVFKLLAGDLVKDVSQPLLNDGVCDFVPFGTS